MHVVCLISYTAYRFNTACLSYRRHLTTYSISFISFKIEFDSILILFPAEVNKSNICIYKSQSWEVIHYL